MAINEKPLTGSCVIKHRGKNCESLTLSKIVLGVEDPNGEREIIQTYSKADGRIMNRSRTKVDSVVIYDRQKVKRSNWFILDLETGRGTHNS